MASPAEIDRSHDSILHEDIILSPEWFRHPRLILNPTIFPVGDHDHQEITDIQVLKNSIQTQFSDVFEHKQCSVSQWDGDRVDNPSGPLVAIQPVLLGELPFRVREAFIHPNPTYFANTLREYLPELPDPLVQTVGSKQMRLDPSIHPNFANLIFIEDSDGLLRILPSDRKIIFARFLMAKLGAFKNILVPYERDDDALRADTLILTTLEGGHPMLTPAEVAQRLLVFGSAKEVGGFTVDPDLEVPFSYWERSQTVSAIRQFGRFLGEKGLLSAPVEITDLVKDPHLGETIVRLLAYTRQAEGALWAIDPTLEVQSRYNLAKVYTEALPLVTASGTSGAVKTNLELSDIIPIIPQADGSVRGLTVVGIPSLKASVEAEEFTLPLMDIHPVRVNGRVMPAFRAGFHIHRGFLRPRSDRIAVISTHVAQFPPVGCGVDLMHRMSLDAMQRARAEMAAGNPAILYLFAVPNHGTNGFIPWGNYDNPYQSVIEAVESDDLVFTPDVPQI